MTFHHRIETYFKMGCGHLGMEELLMSVLLQCLGVHTDMETKIHNIEQEAYRSALRAFKAQSDAITWEKESLIIELRKELRVSDEEHIELLAKVNADDVIRRIREWRKTNGQLVGMPSSAQTSHDHAPSPSVLASCKKQKTSQFVASLSTGAPSPALHPPMHSNY